MIEVFEENLSGVIHIKRPHFADERGFFAENYRKPLYEEMGIDIHFIQDNHSYSKKGTIRGMHFQSNPGQAKLITCLVGEIYDVYVDIRKDSPTFGKWGARVLSSENHEQLFIPVGFAHGFAVLSDFAHVFYKVSSIYNPEGEKTFHFKDPEVGIQWPIEKPILSQKDQNAPSLQEVLK